MIAMNNPLTDLFQCQQRMQNITTCILQVIHQSQYQGNDSLIDDIPTFDRRP